jgi:ADP-ribosylglycohydrolase
VAAAYVDLRDRARRWGPTTTAAVDRLAEGAAPEEAGSSERATNGAAMRAAPLGLWAAVSERERDEVFTAVRAILAVTHRHPAALAAGWGQAAAVRYAAESEPDAFDRDAFWQAVVEATEWAEARLAQASNANGNANATPNGEADRRVSRRLHRLAGQLDSFPLDLRDECDGITARADEAWPFACAMFARRPQLLENSILSGVNVGGDADTTGAMMGALFGALHGWDAFPDDWKEGLEDRERLAEEAQAFGRSVRSS